MRMATAFVAACSVFVATGCRPARPSAIDDQPATTVMKDSEEIVLTDRDLDIIRHVLEQDDDHPSDRIYFLTVTPMDQWGENGVWQDVPASLIDEMPAIKDKYRLARGAYLKQGRVLERGTDKEAWMKWVAIKRWVSDSEVEVEEGVWCCPLGGGASTVTYERVDGKWSIKSLGELWVS